MALIVTIDSLLASVAANITSGRLHNATLHCYQVALTLGPGTTAADLLAVESTFGGYSPLTITDWEGPALVMGAALTMAGVYTWTADGSLLPQSVYGIFLLDSSGIILYAEACPFGAVDLSAAGQRVQYQPVWTEAQR